MTTTAPDTADVSSIGLVHEFSYTAYLKDPVPIGSGPYGLRMYFECLSGEVTGERVRGRVLSGGGDWILVGADGFGRLDVRAQIETHDGAFVYVRYAGVIEMSEAVGRFLTDGTATSYTDHYFRTCPVFETGDERYAWLTQTVFVGEGRFIGGGVEYRVHRVT